MSLIVTVDGPAHLAEVLLRLRKANIGTGKVLSMLGIVEIEDGADADLVSRMPGVVSVAQNSRVSILEIETSETARTEPTGGFRLLVNGERIRLGDEMLDGDCIRWSAATDCVGIEWKSEMALPFRRPL